MEMRSAPRGQGGWNPLVELPGRGWWGTELLGGCSHRWIGQSYVLAKLQCKIYASSSLHTVTGLLQGSLAAGMQPQKKIPGDRRLGTTEASCRVSTRNQIPGFGVLRTTIQWLSTPLAQPFRRRARRYDDAAAPRNRSLSGSGNPPANCRPPQRATPRPSRWQQTNKTGHAGPTRLSG